MKVGLYPRVSTQEQAREGYSISEQIERLKKYCEAKDWTVYKTYTDAGFSGANMNRPGLQQMIEDVQNHKIDMVLVYKLDRLSRSQKDTLHLIEDIFIKNNVHFTSMTENFDTSTPFGRAMIGILSVFAQLEREQFRERSIMGKEARAKEGLYHGGGAPTGYDYIDGQLVINEFESMQIKEIYRLFIEEHLSIQAISKIMQNYHSRWKNEFRVRTILQNPLYAGWTHYRDKLYQGQHQAIITQDDFERSKSIFLSRARDNEDAHPAFERTSLLSGIIWCKNCGARYFKVTKSSKRNGKIYTYPKYECYSRAGYKKNMVKDKTCKNKIWDTKTLDELVLNELRNLIDHPDEVNNLIIKHREKDNIQNNKPDYEKQIASIEKQISRLTDLYAIGDIDINIISEKIITLNNEKKTLTEKMNNIQKPVLSAETAKQKLEELSEIIDTNSTKEMQQIITFLIRRIEVGNDSIFIHWNFI